MMTDPELWRRKTQVLNCRFGFRCIMVSMEMDDSTVNITICRSSIVTESEYICEKKD